MIANREWLSSIKDEQLRKMIERLMLYYEGGQANSFLYYESEYGEIVKRSGTNFRYKEYTFLFLLPHHAKVYIEHLKIVADLKLTTFPELINVIKYKRGGWMIIVKMDGTADADLRYNIYDYTEKAKKVVNNELRILDEAGYVLVPTFRYYVGVTADNKIMIPDFELLKKAEQSEKSIKDCYCRYRMFGEEW